MSVAARAGHDNFPTAAMYQNVTRRLGDEQCQFAGARFVETEPLPVGLKSVATCSVTAADGSANRLSRLGGAILLRPSSASRNPT